MKQVILSQFCTLGLVLLTAGLGCSLSQESVKPKQSAVAEVRPQIVSEEEVEAEAIARWLNSATSNQPPLVQLRSKGAWGFENLTFVSEAAADGEAPILRVKYPAGSVTPSVSRREGVPIGGAQFYAETDSGARRLRLSYRVRFSDNFDFVKGGKLPGLFGGEGASGGNIPNGTNGFSTRLMWRREGQGEVYAYLPTSEDFGTSIGRGRWRFQPGEWTTVEQEVTLNQPGESDGHIRLWVDGELVIDEPRLLFRTVDSLQLDGLFFSTFFGGGDASWATPQDVYVDFADFEMSRVR
ncbi:MAG: polysaccharide lyase [Elainellaceae cyanobacterium]